MCTKKNDLNRLQEANDCVMVSAYQARIRRVISIVKSVLSGIASSIAGQQITCLSLTYSPMLMSVTASKQKRYFLAVWLGALKDPENSVHSKITKGVD